MNNWEMNSAGDWELHTERNRYRVERVGKRWWLSAKELSITPLCMPVNDFATEYQAMEAAEKLARME